jgi:hypothetical protein
MVQILLLFFGASKRPNHDVIGLYPMEACKAIRDAL